MASTDNYNARHLSVLEGLEAVRKRPGMYIGSTDSRGLMHCLWEIIDNSVDEALGGFGQAINVILHSDGSVEVHDDGRGIPVDVEPKTGLSGLEVVFTKLHAGGKFGGGSYSASGGLHGVGASVVNALSARLDVEVDRGGKTYSLQFRRGEPGKFSDRGKPKPDAPFTAHEKATTPEVIGKAKRGLLVLEFVIGRMTTSSPLTQSFPTRNFRTVRVKPHSWFLAYVLRCVMIVACPEQKAPKAPTKRYFNMTVESVNSLNT